MPTDIPMHTLVIIGSEKGLFESRREVKIIDTELFAHICNCSLIRHGIIEFINFTFGRDEDDDQPGIPAYDFVSQFFKNS